MNRRYTSDELRSKLSQYANAHINHIACSEDYIYIRFEEGYGSTYGDSFSQELYVTTIKEMKEACKKSNLLSLADWTAQEAVNEITESFVEEKELEEDLYKGVKEVHREVAEDEIEAEKYVSFTPQGLKVVKPRSKAVAKPAHKPFDEAAYNKVQKEKAEFKKIMQEYERNQQEARRFDTEITLGPYVDEDTIYQTAVYEDPNETVVMDSTIHRVRTLTQEVRVRRHEQASIQ
ncbi:MAG: hypothetical protein K2H85_01145 [Allobaculum sp.]|nr:hypothetical protein [Allobaculum sp.]